MRAWVLDKYGEPEDVLTIRDVEDPSPGPQELLVDVRAAGLGFPDLLRVRGQYQIALPPGSSPGQEFVGIVRQAGEETTTPPGTRVLGISQIGNGSLAERVVAFEIDTAPIADELPDEIAAAVPANYGTAFVALHERGAVQAGESVVVAGAAGGVGSAAIQLAKAAGARVMAIEAGADRAAFCLELGADAAADSTNDNLIAAINDFTEGRGADVIIDMVGGDVFDAGRRAIASRGRIVIVGFTSGRIPEIQVNRLLLRNFAVIGMNAFHYQQEMSAYYRQVADLCVAGKLAPAVDGVYAFDEAPKVLTRVAEGRVRGKAVVTIG